MTMLRRIRDWAGAHPRVMDTALAVLVCTVGLLGAALIPVEGSEIEADWLAYVLIVATSATLYWRRSAPTVALPVATALVVTYWVRDYAGGDDVVLWFLFYAATRHGGHDRRRIWTIVGLSLTTVLVVATIGVIVPTEDLPWEAVGGIFFIHGTAAALGEATYQRSRRVEELEQRAAMLEADLETKSTLAAVEERTRIAREMHDIIAHGMSAIVVQAQGAQRMLDADPDRARDVLETIETIGRDSVAEMRRMLGVLRETDADTRHAPQPGLARTDELIERARGAGVDTAIQVVGDERSLPPGLELTAYRVLQEALTNVVRHGGRPVRAEVTIAYTDDGLEIDVVDDGLGAAAAPGNGTGHGLLGMHERVEIYKGTLRAGPRPGGGYEVHAVLPHPSRPRPGRTAAGVDA